MTGHTPPFVDLFKLSEDERINVIGHTLTCKDCRKSKGKPAVISIVLDDDAEKIKRYVSKLNTKFPGVQVTKILPGLVKGTKTLMISGPTDY